MRVFRIAAFAALLAVVALGCAREERGRVAGPDPPGVPSAEPKVIEAQWIEGTDLARAVSAAASNPLVQRAFLGTGDPRLRLESRYAIQAVGTTADGARVRVTVLPYSREDDPRYASITALIERDGRTLAQVTDLITGREPTSLEEGYELVESVAGTVWIRESAEYLVDAAARSAERRRFDRGAFTRCFATQGPALCSVGVETCRGVAPQFPYCQAVGCGAGMAAAAVYCGYTAFK
jgi:hypothetical protein